MEGGEIDCKFEINPAGANVVLPRLGFEFVIPSHFDQFNYYGRGPHENMMDRCQGAALGRFQGEIANLWVPYAKPMDHGSRQEVRWWEMKSAKKTIRFEARSQMIAAVLPYCALEMVMAPHIHHLPISKNHYLTLDAKQLGVGQGSCGPATIERDRVRMDRVAFEFRIKLN